MWQADQNTGIHVLDSFLNPHSISLLSLSSLSSWKLLVLHTKTKHLVYVVWLVWDFEERIQFKQRVSARTICRIWSYDVTGCVSMPKFRLLAFRTLYTCWFIVLYSLLKLYGPQTVFSVSICNSLHPGSLQIENTNMMLLQVVLFFFGYVELVQSLKEGCQPANFELGNRSSLLFKIKWGSKNLKTYN